MIKLIKYNNEITMYNSSQRQSNATFTMNHTSVSHLTDVPEHKHLMTTTGLCWQGSTQWETEFNLWGVLFETMVDRDD